MALLNLTIGCGRLKPVSLLDETVNVPDRKVIVLFVDGVNRAVFRQMLSDGQLPQIDRYLVQRGVRVDSAVTAAPSITYAITTSLLTGRLPAHHGILGNRYFDRDRLYFADYTSTKTYRDTDADYRAATIYEILDDRMSISIQTAMRRGVYRKIDNWATSGIRWFFNFLTEIDALTAERFYLIGEIARRSGRWPALIFAYFPATDEIGHRYGPRSRQYRRCLQNVDEQIGRIGAALAANGLLESTYLIFVSDHGMAACGRPNYLSLAEALADEFTGLRVTDKGPGREIRWEKRQDYYRRFDVVVSNGGNRRAMIYLRSDPSWSTAAGEDRIRPLADFLVGQAAVDRAAWPGPEGVWVQTARGRALIQRLRQPGESLNNGQYLYRVVDGSDPLGYADGPAGGLQDGRFHSGRAWLAATCETAYPDLVVQAAELFDSRRSGDLMVFAADGWDFARGNVGGHGGVAAVDMQVPMIFAGPGIPRAETISAARTVDIAPTIIDFLDPDKLKDRSFDGRSLRRELLDPESIEALSE